MNMGGFNVADIAAAAIVLFFAVWGAKRGLIKSVLGLSSIIISLILALLLYQPVASFLQNSVIGEYVTVNVTKAIQGADEKNTEEQPIEADGVLKLPSKITEKINEEVETAKEAAVGAVSLSVSNLAIKLISMLAVFLIIKLVLWVVSMLLEALAKLPVIGTLNKAAGGALGAASGILIIYVLLALLTFVTAVNTNNAVAESVLKSKLVCEMYDNNFILNLIASPEKD